MSNVHEGRMKICQNGRGHRCHGHHHGLGHKHRCLAMLVFIKPTVAGHVAHWKKREGPILKFAAAQISPFLHLRRCFFRSHQIKPTSTFQRFWGRGALFQRDKKGTERDLLLKFLIWWKVTPALWLCAREDKHKIGILHFARFSQQRWEGWNLEKNYDLIISTKPRGTHIYLGFSSVSKPAQTGLQFHLALAPALQWSK